MDVNNGTHRPSIVYASPLFVVIGFAALRFIPLTDKNRASPQIDVARHHLWKGETYADIAEEKPTTSPQHAIDFTEGAQQFSVWRATGTSRSTPFLLRSIRSIMRWLSMLLTFRRHSSLRLSPAAYIVRSAVRQLSVSKEINLITAKIVRS